MCLKHGSGQPSPSPDSLGICLWRCPGVRPHWGRLRGDRHLTVPQPPKVPKGGVPRIKRFSPPLFALWFLNSPCQPLAAGCFRTPEAMVFHPSPCAFLPAREARAGISEAASLRPTVAPGRWDFAFQRVPQRAPRLLPTDLQPCLCQGEQILGAREIAESSFPFVLGVLAYLLAFPRQSCLGSTLHTYLG